MLPQFKSNLAARAFIRPQTPAALVMLVSRKVRRAVSGETRNRNAIHPCASDG